MPMPNRQPTDGVELADIVAQLDKLLADGNERELIAFCATRETSIEEVTRFRDEVKRRLVDNKPVLVDKKTYLSVLHTQAQPHRMPHIGAKQIAKAQRRMEVAKAKSK